MSYEQHKSNNDNKKWRIIIASVIFVYLFFRLVPSLAAVRFKTVIPEYKLVEDRVGAEAIIIKKEHVYKAGTVGKIETLVEEGEKVGIGVEIARLTPTQNTPLRKELEDIDEKIAGLKDINQGDVAKNNKLLNQSMGKLEEQREKVIEQLSRNRMNYISKESGIISFKIDGYEELYSYNHRKDYKLSDFQGIDKEQIEVMNGDNVEPGDPLFKIIDNFEWYMIINADNKVIDYYDEGDTILVVGQGMEDKTRGQIERISKEKDKGLILCRFNVDFEKYYDKRHIQIDIIKDSQEGYRIPTRSITEKEGVKGVYVKDISGVVKFKPIKILLKEDRTTCIDSGDRDNNIYLEGHNKHFETVTELDEILLYTTGLKEGMVIN